MSDIKLIRAFWNCGDSQIIDFAIMRARLNYKEKAVCELMLDQCLTQEKAAEQLDLSVRYLQIIWASAAKKLLGIPWVKAYAIALT